MGSMKTDTSQTYFAEISEEDLQKTVRKRLESKDGIAGQRIIDGTRDSIKDDGRTTTNLWHALSLSRNFHNSG